jgi:hypothetical protein
MVQRVDYYALLSRTVEELEPDAYAARGAIYDREHKALLKRLISSAAPCTDADILREERAFRDAIRRIEFPSDQAPATRSPERQADDEAAWPTSSRDRMRAHRREPPRADPQDLDRTKAADARRRWVPSYGQAEETGAKPPSPPPAEQNREAPRRRPLFRLAAVYLVVAVLALGAGGLGYSYLVGVFNVSWLAQLTWLTEWAGLAATSSARAVLYSGTGGSSTPVEGRATWGTRTQPNGPDDKPDTVLTLEAEIPEPHISVSMVLSRNAKAGAGMSHLLELRFAKPQELPYGGIVKIANIAAKSSETEAGDALAGTSVDIAPGQFMFGLLGLPEIVQQNIQHLRSKGWLAINIVFADGSAYTLAIEKGAAGERAIDAALAQWGQ